MYDITMGMAKAILFYSSVLLMCRSHGGGIWIELNAEQADNILSPSAASEMKNTYYAMQFVSYSYDCA